MRARGYALSDQETVLGLRVLAAPVVDVDGVPVAGLSVAAPALAHAVAGVRGSGALPRFLPPLRHCRARLQASGGFAAQTATG